MEELAKNNRFVYVVYSRGLYTVEVNTMHPTKQYTMNVRGNGETIQEAVQIIENKLDAIKADLL